MIILIEEARKLIGEENSKYTDKEIEEMVNIFEFVSDIAIDCYLLKRKKRGGEIENGKT